MDGTGVMGRLAAIVGLGEISVLRVHSVWIALGCHLMRGCVVPLLLLFSFLFLFVIFLFFLFGTGLVLLRGKFFFFV